MHRIVAQSALVRGRVAARILSLGQPPAVSGETPLGTMQFAGANTTTNARRAFQHVGAAARKELLKDGEFLR